VSVEVLFQPGGYRVKVESTETILEAVARQGYRAPSACRNGVCHICAAKLLAGDPGPAGLLTVPDNAPTVLVCKAKPTSDCELEMTNLHPADKLVLREISVQVKSVTLLSADVYGVELLAPAGELPAFYAGQYLQLLIPQLDSAFFSIANAPGSRVIELHILAPPGQSSAVTILAYLRANPLVRIRLPMGSCCLARIPETPVVLVAAGTGFAQIKSMVEWLLANNFRHPLSVYWGVRKAEERYAMPVFESWRTQPGMHCVAIAADNPDNEWTGHHTELVKALSREQTDWQTTAVYASGSPAMVYATQDALRVLGLPDAQFHSDVLEYAPR
jgi:CDP-4-dehydro-6-deoxyglucose reductase